jgi:hypothetical protein
MASEVRINDQVRDLPHLVQLSELSACAWLVTGDVDAADLAAEAVRTIMKFSRWDYFLEANRWVVGVQRAPEATIAVALVSDWLGDRIADGERTRWLETMAERGCEACYRSLSGIRDPHSVIGWSFDPTSSFFDYRPGNRTDLSRRPEITQRTNLRAVPAAALAIGALAVRSQRGDSPRIQRWLEMSVFSLKAFGSIFEADGSYHEGASYANYTALHLATAIEALQRSSGPDPGEIVNWTGYVDYLLNMSMATTVDPSGIVNFGDNGNPQTGEAGKVARSAVPYWIARRFRNEQAQWVGDHLGGSCDIRALIWYDPSLRSGPIKGGPRLWRSANDRIVARTGFSEDDLVVAMRSGPPANHEHADRNSIIVKCFGEQLVTDPNRPPYSFSDPAWSMRLTAAHSAVLIDGKGHQYHNGVEGTNASSAQAKILRSGATERDAWWMSDATQAYRLVDTDIRSVVRGVVVLFAVPAAIIVDRVLKWRVPSRVQARFFGYNWDGQLQQEIFPGGFVVRRPGAVLRATHYSGCGIGALRGHLQIPDEQAVRHPFIELSTVHVSTAVTVVTVLSIARPGAPIPSATIERSGEEILATVRSADRRARLNIRDGEAVPHFTIDS